MARRSRDLARRELERDELETSGMERSIAASNEQSCSVHIRTHSVHIRKQTGLLRGLNKHKNRKSSVYIENSSLNDFAALRH